MDRPAGSPVIIRNGLYLNKKGVPVMFGRLTLLAEEFQFEYVFRKVDQVWAFENFGLNFESGGR